MVLHADVIGPTAGVQTNTSLAHAPIQDAACSTVPIDGRRVIRQQSSGLMSSPHSMWAPVATR